MSYHIDMMPRMNPRTISTGWMDAVIRGLVAHGLPRSQLAGPLSPIGGSGGLPSRQVEMIEARRLWHRVAELSDDPLLGLKVGSTLPPQAMNIVGLIAMHSPTVEEVGINTAAYQGLVSNSGYYASAVGANGVNITYEAQDAPLAQHPMQVDSILAATILVLRHCGLSDFAPDLVRVTGTARNKLSDYERFFGCPVEMGSPHPGYTLSHAKLAIKLPNADAALLAYLKAHADALLAAQMTLDEISLAVRAAITARAHRPVTLNVIADDLGLGLRTLQRRLADAGTSFRTLYDDARMEDAARLLRQTTLSPGEIADRLGYSELSSFSRAFYSRYGVRPHKVRNNTKEKGR